MFAFFEAALGERGWAHSDVRVAWHQAREAAATARAVSSAVRSAVIAAAALGLSVRQVKRLKAAYQQAGPASLVHGNRGRSTAWALPATVAEAIVVRAQGTYAGLNQQHLTELLASRWRSKVSRGTSAARELGTGWS